MSSLERAPISVIVPCYRCHKTVQRAVESVFNQSLLPMELILVDDASGDETLSCLYGLAKASSPIPVKVVALEQNKGPGSARNAGWEQARGDYIAFLDADDAWHGKKLEIQYLWMLNNPRVMFSGHRTKYVRTSGDSSEGRLMPIAGGYISSWRQLLANRFPTRSVMIKVGSPYRFKDGKRYAEDFLLWSRLLLHGSLAYKLSNQLAYSYKEDFGGGGLTGNMELMLGGIRDSLEELRSERLINGPTYHGLKCWASIKHWRRALLARHSWLRRG